MKQIKQTLMIVLLFIFMATHAQARQTLPDGLGYRSIDSNEASSPAVFSVDDLSATGTQELLDDDDNAADVPIGFTFNFYGVDYTTLSIGSNGYLFFGPNTDDEYNSNNLPIPQAGDLDGWQEPPFIAPWFDDLDPEPNGDPIYWETRGTAPDREFIVQYKVPHIGNNTEALDFNVTLFEGNNDIRFQYTDATTSDPGSSNGISATVGIQGTDTAGTNYQANEGLLSDNLAILFSPPSGPFVGINPSNKTDNSGATVTHDITVFNNTGADQDFNITLLPGNLWSTSAPSTTGIISDGDSVSFELDVVIPALTDLPPLSDQTTVQISGNGFRAIQNIHTQSFPGRRFTHDADRSSGDASIAGDGSRIAFESNSDLITGGNTDLGDEIFLINRDGTGLLQLTNAKRPSSNPSISEDGSRIAFESTANLTGENSTNRNQIFVINSNGTGLKQLTNDASRGSSNASLSSDGSRVAFVSTADHTGGNSTFQTQVFVIDSDGTGLKQLSSHEFRSSGDASLSGDGSRIAFESDADHTGGNPTNRTQIFVIDSDGTGLVQLTNDTIEGSFDASLSNDGSRVAFDSDADLTGGNPDNRNYVFVMNTDGTALTQIAQGWDASLSADGSRVAFETPADYVGIMNSDGTGPLTEFTHVPDADDPSLSSNGAFLAFEGDFDITDGTDQIYVYEVAKADSDGDGLIDTSEGTEANNASTAAALPLSLGGTVDISVPAAQRLLGVSSDAATGGPSGVVFPFGTLFYKTTSGIGKSVTTTLTFSAALPDDLMLYKVDFAGVYTEIPATQWLKTGPNSLELTITDGGTFDLDGVANGVIIDPLAVGDFNAAPTAPELISPADGETGLGTTVDFKWKASTDANNDTLSYDFFICDNNTFEGGDCGPTVVAAAAKKGLTQFAFYGSGLFIFGMVLMGGLKRRYPAFLIALLLTTGLVLAACSSGGSGGSGSVTLSHQASALKAATTYHWKVLASDGKSRTESEVRSFTTQ